MCTKQEHVREPGPEVPSQAEISLSMLMKHTKSIKNICFFVGSISGRGGTERVAAIIANGLQDRGYNIYVLSLWNGLAAGYTVNSSIRLYELFSHRKKFKWSYLTIVLKLRKFLLRHDIDVVISTDVMLAVYAVPARINTDIIHIAWEHFNYLADFQLKIRKFSRYLAAKSADAVVVLTRQDRDLWKAHVKGKADIVVIPNPLSFAPIGPDQRNWDQKLAIAVGRLTYQKGFDLLIKCWKKVVVESPDWKLYILGDGEDRGKLEALVAEEGLESVIEIIPFSHDISDYYLRGSIFCLPSRFEGLPMVLLEAQAFALPSVCFECYTGPSDIINDGVNGFIVKDKNISVFSDRIIRLTKDKSLRKKMGTEAYYIADDFDKVKIIDRWVELLSE